MAGTREKADPRSALVLLSGGQDSAVCLAWALTRYGRVETVGFDYGQRHGVELRARDRLREAMTAGFAHWARRLGPDRVIDIRAFGAIGETAMTRERPIEETAGGLPSTFVPGRNLVFLTYAAALAERRSLEALVGGMCETDYSGYPDCRRETLDALEAALRLGMGRPFPIQTPLMGKTKAQTWALAKALGGEALVEIIIEESHTCYLGVREARRPWGYGCGACPACVLRRRGFETWADGGRPEAGAVTYSVKEIYLTLQGEGGQAGRAAVFCRFSGCNLWSGREEDRASAVCNFCDTDFVGTHGPGGGKFRRPADLASAIAAAWRGTPDNRLAVCTGGEPLLQLDAPLIEALHATGFAVAVETNGLLAAPAGIDWICVSPKADTLLRQASGQELKLVYPQPGVDPARFECLDFERFFLQPMDGPQREAATAAAIAYCLEHPKWRLSVQTHKHLGLR